MKVIDLYKRQGFPWLTLCVAVCCGVVTAAAWLEPGMYEKLAWSNAPRHFWQYFSGAFLHGDGSGAWEMTLAHLIANLLMFVPYAVMLEKLLGHKRFGLVFLGSWLGICVVFQILAGVAVPEGETAYGAGLSGSSYAMTAMGAFVLFRLFLLDRRGVCRQRLAWVFISGLLGEALMLLSQTAGVLSMVIHLAGIGIGIVMSVVFRADIGAALTEESP